MLAYYALGLAMMYLILLDNVNRGVLVNRRPGYAVWLAWAIILVAAWGWPYFVLMAAYRRLTGKVT